MNRINKLIKDIDFVKYTRINKELEKDRVFCKHGIEHSLDVARILYILALEDNLDVNKEIIYASALLHDIGRYAQYEANISHHQAGASIGKRLLGKYDFTEEEIDIICDAIASHHTLEEDGNILKVLLYKADKISRNCFDCSAYEECYWDVNLKNSEIKY